MVELDLSHLAEMSDEELFTEISDAMFDFEYVSEHENILNLNIIGEAQKLLRNRGWELDSVTEVQVIKLSEQELDQLPY